MNSKDIFEYISNYVTEPIDNLFLWSDEDDKAYEGIINTLIALKREDVNDWLWNALIIREDKYDIDNSSLSDDSKAFVNRFINAKRKWLSMSVLFAKNDLDNVLININDDIVGDRVVLKACIIKDNCDLYLNHVKEDGDYALYVTPDDSTIVNVKPLGINIKLPHAFYIYLKESNEEIGVVSLADTDNRHNTLLSCACAHYYIYKEYRHKGYAYEAMRLLIDAFFNARLKQRVASDKHYIFIDKSVNPICIKIRCNSNNKSSNALARKLGFEFEGVNHYYKMMDNIYQDENSYYLDNKMYHKK